MIAAICSLYVFSEPLIVGVQQDHFDDAGVAVGVNVIETERSPGRGFQFKPAMNNGRCCPFLVAYAHRLTFWPFSSLEHSSTRYRVLPSFSFHWKRLRPPPDGLSRLSSKPIAPEPSPLTSFPKHGVHRRRDECRRRRWMQSNRQRQKCNARPFSCLPDPRRIRASDGPGHIAVGRPAPAWGWFHRYWSRHSRERFSPGSTVHISLGFVVLAIGVPTPDGGIAQPKLISKRQASPSARP